MEFLNPWGKSLSATQKDTAPDVESETELLETGLFFWSRSLKKQGGLGAEGSANESKLANVKREIIFIMARYM